MKRTFLLLSVLIVAQSSVSLSQVGGIPGSGKGTNKRLGLAQKNAETLNEYNFESEEILKESGASGYVQLGIDTVTFDNRVSDRNQALPYIKFEVFPFANSNIYFDARTSYRFDYNKPHNNYKENGRTEFGQSNGTYTDLNIGSFYRKGNFYINYKAGFDNYNFDNVKLSYRRQFRFIPRASYHFTENFSWYLKGYLGYVDAEEKVDTGRVPGSGGGTGGGSGSGSGSGNGGGSGSGGGGGTGGKSTSTASTTATIKHEKYIHKLESGLSYTVHDDVRLTLGVVNRTKEVYAGEYSKWLYLSKIDYNLYSSDSLQIRPYFWYIFTPEGESGLNKATPDKFEDESGTRLGVKIDYEFSKNWAFDSEFFWYRYKKNIQGTSPVERGYENVGVARVSFKRYF